MDEEPYIEEPQPVVEVLQASKGTLPEDLEPEEVIRYYNVPCYSYKLGRQVRLRRKVCGFCGDIVKARDWLELWCHEKKEHGDLVKFYNAQATDYYPAYDKCPICSTVVWHLLEHTEKYHCNDFHPGESTYRPGDTSVQALGSDKDTRYDIVTQGGSTYGRRSGGTAIDVELNLATSELVPAGEAAPRDDTEVPVGVQCIQCGEYVPDDLAMIEHVKEHGKVAWPIVKHVTVELFEVFATP